MKKCLWLGEDALASVGIWVVQLRDLESSKSCLDHCSTALAALRRHPTLLDKFNLACPKLLPDTRALAVEQGVEQRMYVKGGGD